MFLDPHMLTMEAVSTQGELSKAFLSPQWWAYRSEFRKRATIFQEGNYFSSLQRIINSQIILKLLCFGTSNYIEHAVKKRNKGKQRLGACIINSVQVITLWRLPWQFYGTLTVAEKHASCIPGKKAWQQYIVVSWPQVGFMNFQTLGLCSC